MINSHISPCRSSEWVLDSPLIGEVFELCPEFFNNGSNIDWKILVFTRCLILVEGRVVAVTMRDLPLNGTVNVDKIVEVPVLFNAVDPIECRRFGPINNVIDLLGVSVIHLKAQRSVELRRNRIRGKRRVRAVVAFKVIRSKVLPAGNPAVAERLYIAFSCVDLVLDLERARVQIDPLVLVGPAVLQELPVRVQAEGVRHLRAIVLGELFKILPEIFDVLEGVEIGVHPLAGTGHT
jgi:hypothetical protein